VAGALRFGILGCARVAGYALIDPARRNPEVVVAAVASRSLERARTFAAQHGIGKAYGGYEALIADPEVDLVYVALPNGLHCEWSIRALRAGKAVLCEKPLAANAEEAARMAAAARSAGRPLIEAFHFRYHPVAGRIREIVRSGVLGTLRSIEARFLIPARFVGPDDIRLKYELAGGAGMDLGCYCVNALRMVAGAEPTVERAAAVLASPDVDVALEADLRFPGGCAGRIACAFNHREDRWQAVLKVVGECGELEVINPFLPHAGHSIRLTRDGRGEAEELDKSSTYDWQLGELVRALRDNLPIRTPADDGVANMRVIDDIYRAAGMRTRGAAGLTKTL
jgi:predicted dehydrogenase